MNGEGIVSLLSMLNDPAPGLRFDPHDAAEVGERVYSTPHYRAKPAGLLARLAIRKLCKNATELQKQLLALYSNCNGVGICLLPPVPPMPSQYMLELYPVQSWRRATSRWKQDDYLSELLEQCPVYASGTWMVIGALNSEGMSLVLFFDGEYKGINLAGRCFCIGLDGYLSFEDELAESFTGLTEYIGTDLIGLTKKLGYSWCVAGPNGSMFGDVPEEYMKDVRGSARLIHS